MVEVVALGTHTHTQTNSMSYVLQRYDTPSQSASPLCHIMNISYLTWLIHSFLCAFFSSISLFCLQTSHAGLNLSGLYTFHNIHTHMHQQMSRFHDGMLNTLASIRHRNYFFLFFLSILVLSFCYNRIFLIGGFPFLCIVLPSSCHSASVVLIS